MFSFTVNPRQFGFMKQIIALKTKKKLRKEINGNINGIGRADENK
jgi:hypothetical protein